MRSAKPAIKWRCRGVVPLEEYQLKNGWGVAVADCTREFIAAERGSEIARDSRSEIDMLLYIHIHAHIYFV